MQVLTLLGTALVLGVRHGIDWDHIAAIADIAGANTAQDNAGRPIGGSERARALWFCLLYALGHALVVAALGVAALTFAAVLPAWVDDYTERIVGATLLILGLYVVYSFSRALVLKDTDFRPQSRWMLLMHGVQHCIERCRRQPNRTRGAGENAASQSYGASSVFLIGMLHGIGAETGTQVLLIAAVGGAATHGFGLAMLLAFIVGLIISNSIVALIATNGIAQSARFRSVYLASSALVALFSLIVGTFFVLGDSSKLPDLQVALSHSPM